MFPADTDGRDTLGSNPATYSFMADAQLRCRFRNRQMIGLHNAPFTSGAGHVIFILRLSARPNDDSGPLHYDF